jgi:pimeloyl-ACP methyl ester carboxylesterase
VFLLLRATDRLCAGSGNSGRLLGAAAFDETTANAAIGRGAHSHDMNATPPDTIVLIHGFWVTPRSWEYWINRYEKRGYRVLAPGYPGFEVEVEALNRDPSPVEALTVPSIMGHLESVIHGLDRPPILMGHPPDEACSAKHGRRSSDACALGFRGGAAKEISGR